MSRKAKTVAAPVLTTLKLADLLAMSSVATNGAIVAELTRRIAKRAAEGKHPMPHVITARDMLATVA